MTTILDVSLATAAIIEAIFLVRLYFDRKPLQPINWVDCIDCGSAAPALRNHDGKNRCKDCKVKLQGT